MIKINMEMPDACMHCPFYRGSRTGGDCSASYYGLYFAGVETSIFRHKYCPLQEVEDDD